MPRPLHCRMITSNSFAAWHSGSSPGSPVRTCVKRQAKGKPQNKSSLTGSVTPCVHYCCTLPSCTCCRWSPGIWCQIGGCLCQLWHSCEGVASYLKQKEELLPHRKTWRLCGCQKQNSLLRQYPWSSQIHPAGRLRTPVEGAATSVATPAGRSGCEPRTGSPHKTLRKEKYRSESLGKYSLLLMSLLIQVDRESFSVTCR